MSRARALLAASWIGFVGLSCKRAELPAPSRDIPVIVISIDTLRSDRLPVYGYARGVTPAIDRFRRDSVLFTKAFSHCPLTLPSHASLLTGMLPTRHGVRDNVGYVLGTTQPTLATTLASGGYRTGAAVSSYVLRRATGIARGFEFFDDRVETGADGLRTQAERDGDATRLALESWLGASGSHRVFALLHIYEPHAPYGNPLDFTNDSEAYDAEITRADAIVGRFLDTLRQRGLYDDALVILLSDHGEGLGDHGEDEHGVLLYREALQVPLLVKLPGSARRGETIDAPAGLADVLPMTLASLGLPPVSGVDGRNLLAADPAGSGRKIYAETYFPRLHFGWHELRSLVGDEYHYIDAPTRELYRYRSDPNEKNNLAAKDRRVAFALAGELALMGTSFEPPSAVDPEDQRKLAALGYLGGPAARGASLADPKTKVASLRQLRLGTDLVRRGEGRRAFPHLDRFVKENGEIADGWWWRAQALRQAGRPQEALRSLEEGRRRFPEDTNLMLSAADLLFESGRLEDARAAAMAAIPADGVLAREFLARMELRRKRYDAAEKELLAALVLAPDRTETLMLMAEAMRAAKRPAEDLKWLDRAAGEIASRQLPPIEGLHFHRGEALLALSRVREAEAAFRRETELYPRHYEAWGGLAVVTGAQGRREEARAILVEAMKKNGDAKMRRLAIESLQVLGDAEGARRIATSPRR